MGAVPGPGTLGWVNVLRYLRDPLGFWTRLGRTYGDLAFVRLGTYDCYLVNSPRLIKHVLVTEHEKLVKPRVYEEGTRIFGQGLGTSDGELHARQRRLIQPLFSRQCVASHEGVMVAAAERARKRWRGRAVIPVFEEMSRVTLEVIGKALFGTELTPQAAASVHTLTSSAAVLHRSLLPLGGLLWRVPLPATRRFVRARTELDRLIYDAIAERREAEDRGRDDLLSLLVAAHDVERDRQVRDEVVSMLLPGSETTAVALTWTWYLLSQHSAVEAKLHRELDQVLGSRLVTADDVERLAYTRMVLQEAMRLIPPAWTVARGVSTDFELDSYRVPAGSILVLSQWVTHRDPRFFSDPLSFRPERWLTGSESSAFFPFGGGPRTCLGERFAWTVGVLVLATLGQQWQLRLVPGCEPEPKAIASLRPRRELLMTVHPRAAAAPGR